MVNWKEHYMYEDGHFIRRVYKGGTQYVGSINNHGYVQFEHEGRTFALHRAIWEMHNGEIPKGLIIDHIDRVRANNRIENLRLATHGENQVNAKIRSDNTTGYVGVRFVSYNNYRAVLTFRGKQIHCGYFKTAEAAHESVSSRRRELYGDFAGQ